MFKQVELSVILKEAALMVSGTHITEDVALVFSEFTPEGTLVPLSWVAQIERAATEPVTIVRVDASMVDLVRGVL